MMHPDLKHIPDVQPAGMWQPVPSVEQEKPKRDGVREQPRSSSLLPPHEFGFVSPLPLEVCVASLERRSELGRASRAYYPRLLIRAEHTGAEQYSFYVEQDAGRSITTSARGTLTRLQGETADPQTWVQGRVFVNRAPVMNTIAMATAFCGMMLFLNILPGLAIGLLVALLLVWLNLRQAKHRQRRVADLLQHILEVEKQKRDGGKSAA